MANDIQIQEPNDLGDIHITDPMAEQIAVLVYSKDASSGGIKRLGLFKWKEYLDYDYKRVKNLRDNIDRTIDLEVPFPSGAHNIREQIDNIASLTGVPVDPPATPPAQTINERLESAETTLGNSGSGLVKKVNDNSNDIQALTELVEGSGGGGSSSSITARLNQAEMNISSQGSRITTLEETVGNSNDGLVKDVADLGSSVSALSTTVGDDTDGLVKDVADLGSTVTDLQGVVGDASNGLVKKVNDNLFKINQLDTIVGANENLGLRGDVSELKKNFKIWESGYGSSLSQWLNTSGLLFLISAYKSSGDKTFLGLYNIQSGTLNELVGDKADFFSGSDFTILTPVPNKLTATRLA